MDDGSNSKMAEKEKKKMTRLPMGSRAGRPCGQTPLVAAVVEPVRFALELVTEFLFSRSFPTWHCVCSFLFFYFSLFCF